MLGRYEKSSFVTRHRQALCLVAAATISVILIGSISTYHPDDPSLVHYTSAQAIIQNMFGVLGANLAAVMLFCFGGIGTLGIIGALLWYMYNGILSRSFMSVIDRWMALILVIPSAATLAHALHKDLYTDITPGGLLGISLDRLFSHWFSGHAPLFSGVLLSAALLVFFQSQVVVICKVVLMMTDRLYHAWWWKPVYGSLYSGAVSCGTRVLKGGQWISDYVLSGVQQYRERMTFEFSVDEVPHEHEAAFLNEYYAQRSSAQQVDHARTPVKNPAAFEPLAPATGYTADAEPIHQAAQISFDAQQVSVAQPVPPAPEAQRPYTLPAIDIFIGVPQEADDKSVMIDLQKRARILEEKLERFGVYGKVSAIKRGPVVTVFEYQPDIDTKLSKILGLEDDLALALQALSIRIIAPIPGRSVVGFEVANVKRKTVHFSKIIVADSYQSGSATLPLILGEDTTGSDVVVDLARMPHLLVAGSTGAGKSVALNSMLVSLLCKLRPDQLKLILVDPKRLEFAPYADIPHLVFPIVTDPKKSIPVLRFVVKEMEERYERMAQLGARNITDFHKQHGIEQMPFLVVVIDELADLMMTAGRDVEDLITRIAQMARAAGIHMIVATQRPSVDVITGLIKVNFPSRVAFRVTSKIDSRTILDATGADKLLGKGDMLFLDSTSAAIRRVHGAYVSDKEINTVVSHLKQQGKPVYVDLDAHSAVDEDAMEGADDHLYKEVLAFIETIDELSISLLQRRFRIGYNRSARIIELLEMQGRILPSNGGKMRKIVR